MQVLKNLSIKQKLIIGFLSVGMVPLLIVSFLAYRNSSEIIIHQVENEMESVNSAIAHEV
jgi:vacuolar-type H+-ATPase subunit I/STV1